MAFTTPIFTELKIAQRRSVEIPYAEFYSNRSWNIKSTDTLNYDTDSRLSRNVHLLDNVLWKLL
jgi:hypothetical protein